MQINPHTAKIIEISGVSFSYDNHEILKDIDLDIHKGDYLGIVGPNGGGKTTLIKLVLGLLKPNKGEIKIFDTPINEFTDWKKIGYVAQKVTNFDPLFPITAAGVVGLGKTKEKENIKWALAKVEMAEFGNRLIGNLSGGQQQRIFIARALAQKPEILFLDEPTTGIDASSQKEFLEFLRKLNRELGITLIFISHDINIVTEEATEIAYINKGIKYFHDPKEFLKEHIN